MGDLPNFLPSVHGLHYANSWASAPVVEIPTPFGNVNIGDAKHGLCGGMAYAVRDLFQAQESPPPQATNPASTSPAFHFITTRLIDSFDLPDGVAKYYEWMNLPTGDEFFVRGTSRRTIDDSMPAIRAAINAGHPCALGLVCVHSAHPQDLGQNHQVLACGYSVTGSTVTVEVYDPNQGQNDGVTITFDSSQPTRPTRFAHNLAIDRPIRGFFRTAYSPTPVPAP